MKSRSWIALVILGVLSLLVSSCDGSDESVKEEPKKTDKTEVVANKFLTADRISPNSIRVSLKSSKADITNTDVVVREYGAADKIIPVVGLKSEKNGKQAVISVESLALDVNYEVGIITADKTNFLEAQFGDDVWNAIYSAKPLGVNVEGGKFVFRVFSPRATAVVLCMFDKPYSFSGPYNPDEPGEVKKGVEKFDNEKQIPMKKDENGVWEVSLAGSYWGKLYGYRVSGPKGGSENFNPAVIVADPYSKALATKQVAPQHHLTVIVDPSKYKWESKNKYAPIKRREAIVYEMHVRDMTMLSPDVKKKGTYEGLVEEGKTGGIEYIKKLGVNMVELLPTHEFNEIEEPYYKKQYANKWNTYGRNHWGYMTTCFFAPEAFYAEGTFKTDDWIGVSGNQVYAFKKMVDVFHKNGIGVMMDVVFNHVSQYDRNPFKFIDQKYYFWLNAQGAMDAKSGCGNDYRTDRPMARRVIVDSCVYWVDEYRIDGYRFDLGTIIDWKTYETLIPLVRKLNPECHLTAEPWMGGRGEPRDGGGYALNDNANGFDKRDMGAWNDKFRQVVRNSGNLVFGGANLADLKNAVLVYPKLFPVNAANSFNYIESHDNNTLGDIIREGNKEYKKNQELDPAKYLEYNKLNEKSLKQHKLGALFLLTSQGVVMMHMGQELARMKMVYPPAGDNVFPTGQANWVKNAETKKWVNIWGGVTNKWSQKAPIYTVDHDSYEKDNEGNWIDFRLLDVNRELFDYYRGLIQIRKNNKAFSTMDVKKIQVIDASSPDGKTKPKSAIGYVYDAAFSKDSKSFTILVNGSWAPVTFVLPEGDWTVVADGESSLKASGTKSGTVTVEPMSGFVLSQPKKK